MGALKKHLLLFFMWLSIVSTSPILTIIGTTLSELQCHYHVDLDVVSRLFLPLTVGCVATPLLTHVFAQFLNMHIQVMHVLFMVGYGIGISFMALTPSIGIAAAGAFLAGFSSTGLYIISFHSCNILFPEQGYPFHILGVGYALGSLLTPFIAEPFLLKSSSQTFEWSKENTSNLQLLLNFNFSEESMPEAWSTNNKTDSAFCAESYLDISYLYILLGIINLPSIIGILLMYIISRNDDGLNLGASHSYKSPSYGIIDDRPKWKHFILVGSALMLFSLSCALPYVYGNYIMIVSENTNLQFEVDKAALITSIFWSMHVLGRIGNTFFMLGLKQETLLCISYLLTVVAALELASTFNQTSELYFWIGTLSLGFVVAPQFSGVLAWYRGFSNLSPSLIGLFTIADLVGVTGFPFVGAQVLDKFGERVYLYFILGLAMFEMIVFSGIRCFANSSCQEGQSCL